MPIEDHRRQDRQADLERRVAVRLLGDRLAAVAVADRCTRRRPRATITPTMPAIRNTGHCRFWIFWAFVARRLPRVLRCVLGAAGEQQPTPPSAAARPPSRRRARRGTATDPPARPYCRPSRHHHLPPLGPSTPGTTKRTGRRRRRWRRGMRNVRNWLPAVLDECRADWFGTARCRSIGSPSRRRRLCRGRARAAALARCCRCRTACWSGSSG